MMYVVKRDGKQQSCQFDKIQSRISKLCYGLDSKVRFSFDVLDDGRSGAHSAGGS